MPKSNGQENKPKDLETKVNEQLGILGENEPIKPEVKGAFVCFVKGSDGKIERIEAQSFWRLLFAIGVGLVEKYSSQFNRGVVFKIVRDEEKK